MKYLHPVPRLWMRGADPRQRGAALLIVAAVAGMGCADRSPSAPSPAPLVVVPAHVSLATGQTHQFRAESAGANAPSVRWRLDGDAASGTISATGLYTAPSTVPAGGLHVRVLAERSDAGAPLSAAGVSVTPPAVGEELALSVIMSDSVRARAF